MLDIISQKKERYAEDLIKKRSIHNSLGEIIATAASIMFSKIDELLNVVYNSKH